MLSSFKNRSVSTKAQFLHKVALTSFHQEEQSNSICSDGIPLHNVPWLKNLIAINSTWAIRLYGIQQINMSHDNMIYFRKHIWMFPKIGVPPKWMVYNGKPFKNGWFGGTIILENTCTKDSYSRSHVKRIHENLCIKKLIWRKSKILAVQYTLPYLCFLKQISPCKRWH